MGLVLGLVEGGGEYRWFQDLDGEWPRAGWRAMLTAGSSLESRPLIGRWISESCLWLRVNHGHGVTVQR